MNRKDLEVYVARLQREFSDAYETQRAAAVHAVTLMRRLTLATALLDTFTVEPDLLPTELPDPVEPPQSTTSLQLVDGPEKDPGPGSSTVNDYEQVAAIVKTAAAERRPVSVVLMETFGITRSHATTLIGRCKERGLLPRDLRSLSSGPVRPVPDAAPPAAPVAADASDIGTGDSPTDARNAEPECDNGGNEIPRDVTPQATTTSMEWDLPKRRPSTEPDPEVPRRAVPRAHGGSGVAFA